MRYLTTVADVVDALGGNAAVARMTGRTPNAVTNWRARLNFPPDTFVALTAALAEAGCVAPASLWRMMAPRPAPAEGAAA